MAGFCACFAGASFAGAPPAIGSRISRWLELPLNAGMPFGAAAFGFAGVLLRRGLGALAQRRHQVRTGGKPWDWALLRDRHPSPLGAQHRDDRVFVAIME